MHSLVVESAILIVSITDKNKVPNLRILIMKRTHFFQRIQAAHSLSLAMSNGQAPKSADLATLGLPEKFKSHFKR